MPVSCTPFAYCFTWVHDVYVSLIYRLQAPPSGGTPTGQLRISTNGPGTSPNQLPESTTAHFGLKVEPYTLDPGSPPFIDPITGEVAQRPHTTHVSPPAVVTSSMMGGPGNGSGRYRKSSYKLTSKSSNNSGSNNGSANGHPNLNSGGYGHHGATTDANSFLTAFGSPTTTSSPFDPTNPGLTDQVSYGTYLDCYAAHHLSDDDPSNGITSFSKQKWRTMSDNYPSTVCHFLQTKRSLNTNTKQDVFCILHFKK